MLPNFKKKQKRNTSRVAAIAIGGVFILVVAVLLIMVDVKMYRKRQELSAQVNSLKSKVEELKTQNSQLNQGISESDNPKYIEKVAREELDLQKPGEKVFSFVMPDNKNSQPAAAQQNIIQSWAAWIGGWFKK